MRRRRAGAAPISVHPVDVIADQSDQRDEGRVKPNSGTSRGRLWDVLDVPMLLLGALTVRSIKQGVNGHQDFPVGAWDVSTAFQDVSKRSKTSQTVQHPRAIGLPVLY